MNIPDRISDMDSVPETISLRTSVESADAMFSASIEHAAETLAALTDATRRATRAWVDFGIALTVTDLPS